MTKFPQVHVFLYVAILVFLAIIASCMDGAAKDKDRQSWRQLATETRTVPPFHAIKLLPYIPCEIYCEIGKSRSLSIESDEVNLRHITTIVKNGELTIDLAQDTVMMGKDKGNVKVKIGVESGGPNYKEQRAIVPKNVTKIWVYTPNLNRLYSFGNKVFISGISGKSFDLEMDTGDATLSGTVENLTAQLKVANLNAQSLNTQNSCISTSGWGNCREQQYLARVFQL